jgi:hypothetical protein
MSRKSGAGVALVIQAGHPQLYEFAAGSAVGIAQMLQDGVETKAIDYYYVAEYAEGAHRSNLPLNPPSQSSESGGQSHGGADVPYVGPPATNIELDVGQHSLQDLVELPTSTLLIVDATGAAPGTATIYTRVPRLACEHYAKRATALGRRTAWDIPNSDGHELTELLNSLPTEEGKAPRVRLGDYARLQADVALAEAKEAVKAAQRDGRHSSDYNRHDDYPRLDLDA